MNLTIKNVPRELYERLKQSAQRNRRSLNSEIILRLEEAIGTRPRDVAEWLAEARAVRERLAGVWVTDDELRAMKEDGRA